jgi:G:T/U-mismatch repair DNA glycosylase
LPKQNSELQSRLAGATGRDVKNLDDDIESLRSKKEKNRRCEAERKHKDLARKNKDIQKPLSQVTGRDTKSLYDEVERTRLEMEKSHRQEKKQKQSELTNHENDLRSRLAVVTGRDSKSLNGTVEAARRQKPADRQNARRQKAYDLQALAREARSPIQTSFSDASSPSFTFSSFRIDTSRIIDLSSPSPLKSTRSELSTSSQSEETKVFDLDTKSSGSTTSSRNSLGQKRIVEAQARNEELLEQNVLLRKRLAEANVTVQKD